MPIVNSALIRAGYERVNSIVTMFDSGGDSGRMRTDERGRILAYSDYWRSMISLWKKSKRKETWEKMLRYRDGRGRNFGNAFFQFLSERAGGLTEVEELFCQLTGAEIWGSVIPASDEPANLCFRTISGKEYVGEHYLDQLRMSRDEVEAVWLSPTVAASSQAIEVVKKAEVVIFCPGSMYGSVMVNLLLPGLAEEIVKSRAKKVLITNIMSTANENHGFDTDQYCGMLEKYLGKKVIDAILVADLEKINRAKLAKVLRYYAMENSYPILPGKDRTRTVVEDIALIEEKNMRLRHSETKLSTTLKNLIE